MSVLKVVIIGPGKVGTAVAQGLQGKGYGILKLDRSVMEEGEPEELTLRADIIFVTTPDSEIKKTIELIANKKGFRPKQTVFHMSGALTSDILLEAAKLGANVVSLHPLQSFADKEHAVKNLPGSIFSVEGEEEAINLGKKVAKDLGGEAFVIEKEAKPLYHAAACIASNYLVTLIGSSLAFLEGAGIGKDKALEAIFPLVKGTLNNINNLGGTVALTGPIARGDENTILEHLEAINRITPDWLEFYKVLGTKTVDVAEENQKIGREKAIKLKSILKEEQR